MFSKNGKFKLWFWGIMFTILFGLGITGLIYRFITTGTFRNYSSKDSNKNTDTIILEGAMPSLAEEETLRNFTTSIFNDSSAFLEVNNGDITLSDLGKLTTTAKYLYLTNQASYNAGLTSDIKTNLVTTSNDLFGNYVRLVDFRINYGTGVCAPSGFDSVNGEFGDGSKDESGTCNNPFMYYVIESIRHDKNTYAVKVRGLYVNEIDYENQEMNISGLNCSENEKRINRTVFLYKDKENTNKVFEQNIDICCSAENNCPTGGTFKLKDNVVFNVNNSGNTYYLRFDKNPDTKKFTLRTIQIR